MVQQKTVWLDGGEAVDENAQRMACEGKSRTGSSNELDLGRGYQVGVEQPGLDSDGVAHYVCAGTGVEDSDSIVGLRIGCQVVANNIL